MNFPFKTHTERKVGYTRRGTHTEWESKYKLKVEIGMHIRSGKWDTHGGGNTRNGIWIHTRSVNWDTNSWFYYISVRRDAFIVT